MAPAAAPMTGQAKLKILAALLLSLATQILFSAGARYASESPSLHETS